MQLTAQSVAFQANSRSCTSVISNMHYSGLSLERSAAGGEEQRVLVWQSCMQQPIQEQVNFKQPGAHFFFLHKVN